MKLLKLLFILLISLSLLTAAVSCGGGDSGDTGGTEDGGTGSTGGDEGGESEPSADGYLYRSGVSVGIISPKDLSYDVSGIFKRVMTLTGKSPAIKDSDTTEQKHEIVLGETARLATSRAKRYIDMQNLEEGLEAWCIYAQGSSVAIYWTSENETLIAEATGYFIENYLTANELKLDDGVLHLEIVDLVARTEAEEAKEREAELALIAEKLGEDAADEMREYLALFTDEFYLWLAGLYDADTGALYYSNSARDNYGYLPDLESTTRGYGWLTGTGMLDNYNDNLAAALPDWLIEKLVGWIQGLQSPKDGFFYHPQWGNNINTSRRGRDLDNATSFLKRIGSSALYDAPNGERGTLGAPVGAVTLPLGSSSAQLASRVVAASLVPDHLSTPEKFRAYLETLDWTDNNTYSSAHKIESQVNQIKNAGSAVVAVLNEFMNEKQEEIQESLRDSAEEALKNKKPNATAEEIAEARSEAENGLWETEVKYESVNGLMKTVSFYNTLGLKVNYADKAFKSAMYMVLLEEPDADGKGCTSVVSIFNPWVILDGLQNNIRKNGTASEADALRLLISERAAELIDVTRRKVALFKKADGSFGYGANGGQSTSQGVEVAVPGTNEGDVNGATIATSSILGHMCNALGISKPNLYFPSDYDKFIEVIENAEPLNKPPLVSDDPDDNYLRFDEHALGSNPSSITTNVMNTGSLEVIADTRAGSSGNVLKYVTKSGANSTAGFNPTTVGGNREVLVFEFEVNIIENNKNTTAFQFFIGGSYMLTLHTHDDGFSLGDSSSTNGSISVTNSFSGKYAYNEWHKIRVEFYAGDRSTVMTKIFVNDTLVGTSDNFMGKTKDGSEQPSTENKNIRIFALSSTDLTVLLDNLLGEWRDKE